MIDVALCFHDPSGLYYRYAATTMLSVFENTSSPVHCHIVHDETLSNDKKAELSEIAKRYGQKLSFHAAPEIDPELLKVVPPQFGRGSLYRLFLHKFIDSDKIIYLDCDIICELDIKELYVHNLGEAPLAIIKDGDITRRPSLIKYCKSLGIAPTNYFNSGVLLMNTSWMRRHSQELLNVISEYFKNRKKLLFLDQDILNIFFNNCETKLLYLDEKFNYMLGFDGRRIDNFNVYANKILHWTGEEKPWKVFSNSSMLYWKYYSKTIWCNNVLEEILKTKNDKSITLYRFLFENERTNFAWLRRYYDWKKFGLFGTLKKRLFSKSAQKLLQA